MTLNKKYRISGDLWIFQVRRVVEDIVGLLIYITELHYENMIPIYRAQFGVGSAIYTKFPYNHTSNFCFTPI